MAREPRPPGRPVDDGVPRVPAASIRTEPRSTLRRIGVFTFAAWLGSLPLFVALVPEIGARAAEQGLVPFVLAWLVMSVLICAGYLLGYWALQRFARGDRDFAERAVPVLAFGDAVFIGIGGFAVGFLPLSMSVDPFGAFAWTMVVGVLFGGAALSPGYIANWRAADAAGESR